MRTDLPTSLSDWEEALTRRFLTTAGEGVGPIRSFDISPETLALAAGADSSVGGQAIASFRKALLADRWTLYSALEDGAFNRKLVADCPGCFAYLALTIFVDSQLDGDDADGSDQFRPKLAAFLGADRKFSNLSGVASMWRSLRDWLARQAKSGKPFRKLILPDDDGWVQIGYSLRLSFPSRRDHTFVGNFFDQHPGITADERAMLETLRNLVDRSSASPGLHDAFDEFHRARLSGQRRSPTTGSGNSCCPWPRPETSRCRRTFRWRSIPTKTGCFSSRSTSPAIPMVGACTRRCNRRSRQSANWAPRTCGRSRKRATWSSNASARRAGPRCPGFPTVGERSKSGFAAAWLRPSARNWAGSDRAAIGA